MRLLTQILALALLVCAVHNRAWSMSESDMDQDILEMKKQLEAMETQNGRSMDIYELRYFPGPIKHITVTDRLGNGRVYYYSTFRLRNPGLGADTSLKIEYNRYNEVLQNIANEYQDIIVDGGQLSVRTETPNDPAAIILQRDELRNSERRVRLSILAFDENGSRMRLLDTTPGKGPQEEFNFNDDGQRSINVSLERVRERIEEQEGRKLLTTGEIAQHSLPVYQPNQHDEETGDVLGEVSGVIIFDDLAANGDTFELQIRGISNKTRRRVPEHDRDKIADYWNMRVYRRSYYVTYKRTGDEYFRDRDAFTLADQGWRWRDTFQRIKQRATIANAEYFLNNITTASGDENAAVVKEALAYYEEERAKHADLVNKQRNLPAIEQELPDIKALIEDGE